jgi:hypothetical protein
MSVETAGGFMGWIQQYGQLILFFAQLLFWLALAVAALWSTMLFKKLVDARTTSADAVVAPAEVVSSEKPSVDKFVE